MIDSTNTPSGEYKPSFIVRQQAQKFGGRQEDYVSRSREIINQIAQRITQARDNKENLQDLFFEIINYLSAQRAQLAKEHKTLLENQFGMRRSDCLWAISHLIMEKEYKKYGIKILKFFIPYLKEMEISEGQFQPEREFKVTYEGRLSSLNFRILTTNDYKDQGYDKLVDEYYPPYISRKEEGELDKNRLTITDQTIISQHRNKWAQFRKDFPENYQKSKEVLVFDYIYRMSSVTERLFVQITYRTQIGNKLFRMTEYYTWIYINKEWIEERDPEYDRLEWMTSISQVILCHQDTFLVEDVLKETAKIFEKNVLWTWNRLNKGIQLRELKKSMALMCHHLTHNMRDARGTSSENELLERAIYQSLGVECIQNQQDQSVDLEAIANPLFSKFTTVYDEMTTLKLNSG